MKLPNLISKIVDKGVQQSSSEREKRLIRTLNFIGYFLLCILLPVIILYNIYVKDYVELAFLVVIVSLELILLKLNQKGKSQLSVILTIALSITIIYPIVYINKNQLGAPYVAILTAFLSIVFVNGKVFKDILFTYGFVTFIITNTYQLIYKPFSFTEHIISLIFVFLIFLIFRYVGNSQNNYELQLEEKNNIILQQAQELIKVQKEKHAQELKIKQYDIEKVVANNSTQIKIKENLIDDLITILKTKDAKIELKRIILDLKHQIDTQKRIHIQEDNIEEVNFKFFERLFQHSPNISKTEKELCLYLKIGLSTKEIAAIKNTSTNTINVTKTRLRNKLGLKKNSEIPIFLRNI